MKQVLSLLLGLTLWLVCLPAPADDNREATLQARLDSDNRQVREQAGQQIFNIGINAPFGDQRRLRAAQMLFTAWQKEFNRQTAQRLLIWISQLGYRIQTLRRIETISGERPHVIIDHMLVPGAPPKPKPRDGKNETKPPPAQPVPDSAPPPPIADKPDPSPPVANLGRATQDERRKRFNPASLLPALASRRDTGNFARNARAVSSRYGGVQPTILPRMNGIHDHGPNSIDTDATNTCGNSRCLKRCPLGMRCTPCDPREENRLSRMREFVRHHPHATVVQTSGLLNIIPMVYKLISGVPIEQILFATPTQCGKHGLNNPNCLGIIPF